MNSITITRQIQDLIDLVYPDLTPRERGNKVRDDIHKLYLERLSMHQLVESIEESEKLRIPKSPSSDPKAVTNRIAGLAQAIDDQNWTAIRRGVTQAQEQGLWDNPTEMRFIARLNDDFGGAVNEYRVQKSRITAFFDRLLS